MPVDRKRYPRDWPDISRQIRYERAGNRCEWCGVENGAIGARDRFGNWWNEDDIHSLPSDCGYDLFGEFPKIIRIVLTVAHLGAPRPDGSPGDVHDKMDCRPENLAALCQRCHLNYDRQEHIHNAKITRIRKRRADQRAAGQMEMFTDD